MYSTSWSSSEPQARNGDAETNHRRASTVPVAMSYPTHPASLMPGNAPRTIHRADIYFTNPTQMPVPHHDYNAYYPPPPPVPHYPVPHFPPYHHQSLPILPPLPVPPPLPPPPPRPPLPQSISLNALPTHTPLLPPVPPKPFHSPHSHAGTSFPRDPGSSAPSIEPTSGGGPPSTGLPADDSDIALALALSQSISQEEEETRRMLDTEEDAELARALKASLIEVQSPIQLEFDSDPIASSSQISNSNTAKIPSSLPYDDETFARLLASEEEAAGGKSPISVPTRAKSIDSVPESSRPEAKRQSSGSSGFRDTFASGSTTGPSAVARAEPTFAINGGCDDRELARLLAAESSSVTAPSLDEPPETHKMCNPILHALEQDSSHHSSTAHQFNSPNLGYADDKALAQSLATDGLNGPPPKIYISRTSDLSNNLLPPSKDKLPQYSVTDTHGSSSHANCDSDEALARSLATEQYTPPAPVNTTESHTPSCIASKDPPPPFAGQHRLSVTNSNGDEGITVRLITKEGRNTHSEDGSVSTAHASSSRVSKGGPPQYRFNNNDGGVPAPAPPAKDGNDNLLATAHSAAASKQVTTSQNGTKPPRYSTYDPSVATDRPSDSRIETHQALSSPEKRPYSTLTPRQVKGPESSTPTSSPTSPPLYSDDSRSSACVTTTLGHSSAMQNSPSPVSEIMSATEPSQSTSVSFSRHTSFVSSPIRDGGSPPMRIDGPSETPEMSLNVSHQEQLGSSSLRPSPSTLNLNAFVNRELLKGVTIGFMAPQISDQLNPMPGEMPLIISLPYGKARPLHLQGSSWKHTLKLMAELSGTRVEPSIDAITVSKTPPKLRTVIQFVKPHRDSTIWRSIFYFTVEYPSPQPIRNPSVNDLPYSYNLAGIPTLLRDAADTPLSKTYTIPTSETLPYPTLPITFPELALYLQAALEDSRKYLNDATSGNRKLAKMIATCYPAEDNAQDIPNRSSVGGLFKRVVGLSNRPSRSGGNEEIYDLVTPFVAEWG